MPDNDPQAGGQGTLLVEVGSHKVSGDGDGDVGKTANKSNGEAGSTEALTSAQTAQTRLTELQQDATLFLEYAAENGIRINPAIRSTILGPGHANVADWDAKTVGDLLAAVTVLKGRLASFPLEMLKARAVPTFRKVKTTSIVLGIIVVLFSAVGFFVSAISATIKANIVTANDLAAKLAAQLGPAPPADQVQLPAGIAPIDLITELQQYASTIRATYARAQQLQKFVIVSHEWIPASKDSTNPTTTAELNRLAFQLPVPLTNFWEARDGRTQVYQRVRSYAQNTLDDMSFLYGTITACILPVLYALFGTCAYLLRAFEQQVTASACAPPPAYTAHFLMAGIGGAVVGLFHYGSAEGASISPLAIAFLVGYSVDVFFAFLDNLVQALKRKPAS